MVAAWLASIVVRSRLLRAVNSSDSAARPCAQRGGALAQALQRELLQVAFGEIDHHRDGVLDGIGVAARFVRRLRRQRKVVGVRRHQHRGEGFARFAERRHDQRVALAGAFDDRIKPAHIAGGGQHLLLIGLGDLALDATHLAEAVEEFFGDAFELLHRAGQHRIGRGAGVERAEHGFAQQQNLREHFRIGLVDVAVNQVLQPAGLALQHREDAVGIADLAHLVPRRRQDPRAVPDHRGEDQHHGRVQGGNRQDAPADRDRAHQADEAGAAPRRDVLFGVVALETHAFNRSLHLFDTVDVLGGDGIVGRLLVNGARRVFE